jgi:hypothetical protein
MRQSEGHELDTFLERKLANLREFRKNQEVVWITVSGALLVSRTLIAAIATDGLLRSAPAPHRLMMWQTVLSYQTESFFLLVDRRIDEGLALLRMAAELARDIIRIGDSEDQLEIWLSRLKGKQQKKAFRDKFRFIDSDETEKYVHKLYDLASNIGIHGHSSTSMLSQPVRRW